MKKKSAFLALLLAGLMSFSVFASACDVNPSGNGGNQGGQTETELTTDTAIYLVAGQSTKLTASAGVTWASSDPTVATVSGSGEVTAKAKGVTKVTATKTGEKVTCTVIVLAASEASSGGTVKPAFTFNESKQIGSVTSTGSGPAVAGANAEEYIVTFSDGAVTQNVAKGGLVVEPLVENDGHYLKGWTATTADSTTYNDYNFNTPVEENLHIEAVWGTNPSGFGLIKGNEESIALEWTGSAQTVEYKLQDGGNWTTVDSELVRENGGSVRADILGLKAGKYDVKVGSTEIKDIPVKAYDRSGYAHFGYNEGVGAYNDDGTLKDGALVIYVTEDNKNNVLGSVYKDGEKFDIPTEYLTAKSASSGVTLGVQKGIGELLNNRRYSGNDRMGVGIAALCNAYGSVVIRIMGTVSAENNAITSDKEEAMKSTINGLTTYNSTENGGSVGDNGRMARMVNAHDLTIEGVGDDASIYGWGVHFIANDANHKYDRAGKGFEVRNITFENYPEDAVGMEGLQGDKWDENGSITSGASSATADLPSPVERCWVHNNTFLPGYAKYPAESDKKEGDGSCDFKRGYYFTASYNYFEYCHKTNLIGSSDSSLQFNLTYHHNIWYQCGSRIPLTRRANVHFYNNYVFGNPAETTTPYAHISKPALSYVHSLRANCYLFSEANYYDGCKNVSKDTGGAAKAYNNTFYACSDGGTGTLTIVDERTQTVANNCQFEKRNWDLRNFDTDSTLFYYDSVNKKSDCLLDDSISARIRAIFYAGAQGHGEITKKMQVVNTSSPVSDPSITKATKGKGQVYTFSVEAAAELTINATGETPQIIRNDGKVYQGPFSGEISVDLDPGIYIVCAGKKDKEITINSLSVNVNPEEAKANRISTAERLISAIPDTITLSSGDIIDQATEAYGKLKSAEEIEALTDGLAERLAKAQTAYEEISVNYVKARINYIGTVTVDSKNDIEEAAKAYAALTAAAKAKVDNYNKLTEATNEFADLAIDSVKFEIDRLPLSTSLTVLLDSKPAVELALELYNAAHQAFTELDEDEKTGIIVSDLNDAIALLNGALNLVEFKELLKGFDDTLIITKDDKAQVNELKTAYAALTETQQNSLTAAEKAKYKAINDAFAELFAGAQSCTFVDGKPSNDMFTSNTSGKRGENFTLPDGSGTVASGMKVEGSTKLQFTTETEMTLTLYMSERSAGKKITIDGTAHTITTKDGYNIVTITLAAGNHTIEKGSSNGGDIDLMYLTLD